MNHEEFIESEMRFRFTQGKVFPLDKQDFFRKMENVKACDFIAIKTIRQQEFLLLIEARSSAPMQKESLKTYLDELHGKYSHSLFLYTAILLGRMPVPTLTDVPGLNTLENLKLPIYLVLVVKKHKREWLMTMQDQLNITMKGIKTAFSINDVQVFNEETASKKGLVLLNI